MKANLDLLSFVTAINVLIEIVTIVKRTQQELFIPVFGLVICSLLH